jgi:hypothetical protein
MFSRCGSKLNFHCLNMSARFAVSLMFEIPFVFDRDTPAHRSTHDCGNVMRQQPPVLPFFAYATSVFATRGGRGSLG